MSLPGVDYEDSYSEQLNTLTKLLADESRLKEEAEKDFFRIQYNNLEKLHQLKITQIQADKLAEIEADGDVYNKKLERINKQVDIERDALKKIHDLGLSTSHDVEMMRKEFDAEEAQLQLTIDNEKNKAEKKRHKEKLKSLKDEHAVELSLAEKTIKDAEALKEKLIKKARSQQITEDRKAAQETAKEVGLKGKEAKEAVKESLQAKGYTEEEIKQADKDAAKKRTDEVIKYAGSLISKLENKMEYAQYSMSQVNTRLNGLTKRSNKNRDYWTQISKDITSAAGFSPYVKQTDIIDKVKEYINKGIAFNVEQRAFLATMSTKIAATFNAADGTLLKLIRIQQADSTAARLGMEAAINAFLNNMYETTEYLSNVASSVRANLYEAEALMGAKEATGLEYQVQKWMGSMYSVGMSDSAVQGLSSALGKLAAGQLEGITQGSYGNLLIMAANNANIPIAEVLSDGLDASKVNTLLNSVVLYLKKIYESTGGEKGSKVLQQQFANIYGLSASDLKAAYNLSSSLASVNSNYLDYGGQISQLEEMVKTIGKRVSTAEKIANVWDNIEYTMAASIANNPMSYALFKVGNTMQQVLSGLEFGIPTVMGSGMASQTFKIADILKIGALANGLFTSLGSIGKAFVNIKSTNMFKEMGVDFNSGNINTVTRGTGAGLLTTAGSTVSESGLVGNSSSEDVKSKSMSETTDSANKQTAEAGEQSEEVTNKTIDSHIVQIYELLSDVALGARTLKVDPGNETSWTNVLGSVGGPR